MSTDDVVTSGNIDPNEGVDGVKSTMQAFIATADISRVYGDPVEHGNTMIIPAAEVMSGLGFGIGFGGGSAPEEGSGGGGGGGGGGRILTRPVAVISVVENGVSVEPVVDATKVALAAITAFGFIFATLLGFLKPRELMENLKQE